MRGVRMAIAPLINWTALIISRLILENRINRTHMLINGEAIQNY
jgi:hypothetical protein